jgi:hypothetical protein
MGTSVFPGGTTETWNDLSVLTTRGDVLYGSSGSPKGTRLGIGGANTHINSDGTDVAWAANETFAGLSPLTTRGDILLATSGTTTGTRLAVGGATEVLTSDGTDAAWSAAGGGLQGVRCYMTADQTIAASVVTEVLFQAETFDVGGYHDVASATGRITIPSGEGGKYLVAATALHQTRNANDIQVIVRKNGTDAMWGKWPNPNSGSKHVELVDVMDLAAADYLQFFFYQDSGSTVELYFQSVLNGGMNCPTNFSAIKLF